MEAKCPNAGHCFSDNTATFLILGDKCPRGCLYCAVKTGIPDAPDRSEPERIAEAIFRLGLTYAVITSVTRDDLPDGGASYFAETAVKIKERVSGCRVELLVPDFKNSCNTSLNIIREAKPDILNHNIETVKSYFPKLRPLGNYQHSLNLIKTASDMGFIVKSGLMVGFGETMDDISAAMHDLIESGCSILTVGQYLSPGKDFYEVKKYYHPDEFEEIRITGEILGFKKILSAPDVRSSYHASSISVC